MITWLAISWIREKAKLCRSFDRRSSRLGDNYSCGRIYRTLGCRNCGLASGGICYYAVQLRIKLDWDDALDVWGVHGVGGMLGSVLVGVFAVESVNGVNGLIAGDVHQFLIQIAAVLLTSAYAFIVTYLILKVINIFVPVRIRSRRIDLDVSIHHEVAYRI